MDTWMAVWMSGWLGGRAGRWIFLKAGESTMEKTRPQASHHQNTPAPLAQPTGGCRQHRTQVEKEQYHEARQIHSSGFSRKWRSFIHPSTTNWAHAVCRTLCARR